MYRILSGICGGFLLAVLWFDLMFDMQVHPHLTTYNESGQLPLDVIRSIESYYQRITIDVSTLLPIPLVGVIMILGIGTNMIRLVKSAEPLWQRVASLLLIAVPALTALFMIVPDAKALARLATGDPVQMALAVKIYYAHILCFISITAFILCQLIPGHDRSLSNA